MSQIEIKSKWDDPVKRAEEASKYNSRAEFRKAKNYCYNKCSYKELDAYFGEKEFAENKVKCDFGMVDYYKYYVKTVENPLPKSLFSKVLKDYLKTNHDIVCKTAQPFLLPEGIGEIVVRKFKRELTIDDEGNFINKFPPNWPATKKLWKENPEAKKKKTLLRHTNEHTDGYFFLIIYKKKYARFKGNRLYKMQINRAMQRGLSEPILKGEIDAFLGNPKRR